MPNLRPLNCDKSEHSSSTVGFIFHANHEELEEVQSKQNDASDESSENKTDKLIPESVIGLKAVSISNETSADTTRDQKTLLWKRSISVDSAYESPFSNPIETWKKLNVLKEKITKTVEGKIFEMKMDRNVLSKSSHGKLIHSKENSSISDSEDTSESSKMSEQYKDAENQNFLLDQSSNENGETHFQIFNNQSLDNVTKEVESKECENEQRNKKNINIPELFNPSDIKIATAKNDEGNLIISSFSEDVESGVEADENLDATEEESIDFFEGEISVLEGEEGGGGKIKEKAISEQTISSEGMNIFLCVLGFFTSEIFLQKNTAIFLLGFILYLFIPLSEFIRGFLLSLLLILFWELVKNYAQFEETSNRQRSFVIPNYKSMPPLKVPPSKSVKGIWFNEYEKEIYDPDFYSVTQTVPAYLELEDNLLRISRPKRKISRRATYDEPDYKLQFVSQRIYNMSGCNILLMPDGLTRKRLFSKKYPIVIFLRPESLISEKKSGKEMEQKELQEGDVAENIPINRPESPKNKSTIYLFARCDRQKEEWYRRLLTATRLGISLDSKKSGKLSETVADTDYETEKTLLDDSPNKEPSTPFENLFFDDEVAQLEEYLRYMANFVDVTKIVEHSSVDSEEKKEKKHEDTGYSDGAQWFSAFVNRILFDVFRSPYWLSKIRNKVQRKLNSIRLPYYIEDIEVIEMDLGKTGPMFHRVSQPYLDDRGLWFDMDVTFDGLIKLTIQTHLNLIKLQKGMEENEEAETQITGKPKKRKKKQRIEKECKDSFLIKDSRSPIYDSELEDSAESSDEDDEEEETRSLLQSADTEEQPPQSSPRKYPRTRKSSKKIFKVFENVAQSKYFRSMAQSKYIQKAIAGVSAAKLRLTLEIKSCTGILAVNIPPPPSDRFWYGFRKMPTLVFSANPKIGDKTVRFIHIKNYLQKKILHELKKVMVSPNMIDFVLPTSSPTQSSNFLPIEEPDLQEGTFSV